MFIYSGVHWDLNLLCGVDLCQVSAPLWAMRFELDVFPPLRTWDCQVQGVMEVQCQRVAWCTCVCVCVRARVCVIGDENTCVLLHWMDGAVTPRNPQIH